MSIGSSLFAGFLTILFTGCAMTSSGDSSPSSASYWVYISYSPKDKPNGIRAYRMNAQTGTLAGGDVVSDAPDPNFLALSTDQRFLYASTNTLDAQKKSTGSATAFAIDAATGKLRLLNTQRSHGNRAVHVSLDPANTTLLVANYQGNTVAALGLNSDGSLMPATPDGVRSETGSGPNPTRQQHPYLHSIYPDPAGKFVYACDLGTDKIHVFALDPTRHSLTPVMDTVAPPGCGPRHLAFSADGKHAYLVTEMGNAVITYAVDASNGHMNRQQILSSLPPGLQVDLEKQTASEIHLHPNGRFLYVSNRGPHSSITLFAVEADGQLRFLDDVPSGGSAPRYFGIDPAGKFLFAGNQNSDNVHVFKIDEKTGKLSETGQVLQVPAPMCVVFVRAH
jgi:6-phosphogluconolactonase